MSRLLILLTVLVVACCINGHYPSYGSWDCKQPIHNTWGTHSVFIGCVRPTDRLLYSITVYKGGSYWGTAQQTVRYPNPAYLRNKITGVWLYDYDRFRRGGFGRVLSGGVGYEYVTIDLRSYRWGGGLNFHVEIYGS